MLASERVDALREAVKAWCRDEGLSAWDRRDQTGLLRNLVVREGRRTGQLQARLVTSPGDFRADELAAAMPADSVLWTRAAGVAETTRDGETEVLKGAAKLEEELSGLRFRISPDAFFQTNTEMAERLYGAAGELAGLTGRERVLDLFCGIGTIALTLALDAGEVWGVELVEEAVADAIENARLNGVDNAKFFAGDVRTAMRPLLERSGKPDVVVVDPPRAGLSQKIVRRCSRPRPSAWSTCRATPRRWRPTPARWSTRATCSRRCGRWTCSRRRRTSSAWRCCAARRPLAGAFVLQLVHRHLLGRVHGAEEAPVGLQRRRISRSVSCAPHSAQVRSITGSRRAPRGPRTRPPPSPRSPRRAAPAGRWPARALRGRSRCSHFDILSGSVETISSS